MIKAGYYKACCDYGRFLIEQKKYEEAKVIFKKGFDNGQQFCLGEYCDLLLWVTNFKQIFLDYKLISYILKNLCIYICIDKLGTNNFFYIMYYLIKHSTFKQQILRDYGKYAIGIFKEEETYLFSENLDLLNNNFAQRYTIEIPNNYGKMCYYGISDLIKSDKERALIYLKKSYQLAKEKKYGYYKRDNYLFIYKCRKYLYKENKISSRKMNKTKEKLFRLYEECDLNDLSILELYNYYKLYKIGILGNKQNKLITLLKKGKNSQIRYHFEEVVHREKCKKL